MGFPEPDLVTAAENCYGDLYPTWVNAGDVVKGLKPTVTAFCASLIATFPANMENGRPCADLLAVSAAQADQLPAPDPANVPNLATYDDVIVTIYKLLYLTNQLATQTPAQITTAQAAAVLAAFNTAFNV